MPVRVLIELEALKGRRVGSRVRAVALLNTGYTGSSPEIIVPVGVAERLGLWPPPRGSLEAVYETVAGAHTMVFIESGARLRLLGEEGVLAEATVNLAVSTSETEVLLSDYVISELGIVILDALRGHWRLRSDPPDRVRYSHQPGLQQGSS